MGYGYAVWLKCAQVARGDDSATIMEVIDEIKDEGELDLYFQSGVKILANGSVTNFTLAWSADYPAIAASIKEFFCPPVGVPAAPSGAVGAIGEGAIINVRTATDIQLDSNAQIGLSRLKLYLMGGVVDVEAGTITNLTWPIFSSSFLAVLALPRTARAGALASLLKDGFDTVRRGSHLDVRSR